MSCSFISSIYLCFGFCSLHPPPKPPSYFSPPGKARLLLSAREPPARLGSTGGGASWPSLAKPCPGSGVRTPRRREQGRGLELLKPSEGAQSGRDALKAFPLHRPYPLGRSGAFVRQEKAAALPLAFPCQTDFEADRGAALQAVPGRV